MTRIGSAAPQPRAHIETKMQDARASTIPCPMLSVLVMEDLIKPDRDGNVDLAQLKSAFEKVGFNRLQRVGLAHGGASALEGDSNKAINLFRLMGSSLDHKGSLGPLQNGGFNKQLLDDLKACSKDGKTLTLEDLSTAQELRMRAEGGGTRDKIIGRAEISALLLVFGKPNADGQKAISLKDITTIFQDNRLPADFKKQDVSTLRLVWNMAQMAFMQHTTAAGRADAGLKNALDTPRALDASSMKGLGAMCPAGMRPKGGVGINPAELSTLHASMNQASA
jgi:hypothetical protein